MSGDFFYLEYVSIKHFRRTDARQPSKIARYNKKEKFYVEIDFPQIKREYNALEEMI